MSYCTICISIIYYQLPYYCIYSHACASQLEIARGLHIVACQRSAPTHRQARTFHAFSNSNLNANRSSRVSSRQHEIEIDEI